jgi:hypothetical protein
VFLELEDDFLFDSGEEADEVWKVRESEQRENHSGEGSEVSQQNCEKIDEITEFEFSDF